MYQVCTDRDHLLTLDSPPGRTVSDHEMDNK
jgi:hypothetical protein